MKRGFTLIEVLVVLFTLPLILVLSLGILLLMGSSKTQEDHQFLVFQHQYRYLMQTVVDVEVVDTSIHYSFDSKPYVISYDKQRLVKTPGYEILLFDVLSVEMSQGCLTLIHKAGKYCLEI